MDIETAVAEMKTESVQTDDVKRISMVFTGDIMVHEEQLAVAQAEDGSYDFSGYFENTKKYIQGADIAVCNLETTLGAEDYSGAARFCTPDALADAIAEAGFDVVATANNHAYDRERDGLVRTRRVLEEQGMKVIGTRKEAGGKAYTIIQRNGVQIGILNFTYRTPQRNQHRTLNNIPLEDDAENLINSFCYETLEEDFKTIQSEIRAVRNDGAEVVIAFYHWGTEYERYSNGIQKYIAWRTASMGVDAIIGSHPHTLQEMEYLHVERNGQEKTVPVFYSLGNYIWGGETMPQREYGMNTVLARLDIEYHPASPALTKVNAGYVPLYINSRFSEDGNSFEILDLTKDNGAYREQAEQIRAALADEVRAELAKVRFEKTIELRTGEKLSLLSACFQNETMEAFEKFCSENAVVASVLQNGEIIGNSAGYAFVAVVTDDKRVIYIPVHVSQGGPAQYPVIVNEYNLVPDHYMPEDCVLGEEYGLPEGVTAARSAAEAWSAMQDAAEEEGVSLSLQECFRTKKAQAILRNDYASRWGEERASRRYMPAGGSEHHLGLAMDIVDGSANGIETDNRTAITWVLNHAHRFGFLARQGTLTAMPYVHVRYLGSAEECTYLYERGLTLKEYLQDYDKHQESRRIMEAWKASLAAQGKSRELTLRKICELIGIKVPGKFRQTMDWPVPLVALGGESARPGSVYFRNSRGKEISQAEWMAESGKKEEKGKKGGKTSQKIAYDDAWIGEFANEEDDPKSHAPARFIAQCRNAVQKGASAVIAQSQLYDAAGKEELPTIIVDDTVAAAVKVGRYIRDLYPAKTVCVTGSVGKSTMTSMIYLVLSSKFNTHTSTNTNNANDRINIMRLLQQLRPEHEMYVQETAGAFPGLVDSSSAILQPSLSVITNIGTAHLSEYKTIDNIAYDKLAVYRNMKPDGMALFNLDDAIMRELVGTDERIVSYSIEDPEADYFADDIEQTDAGLSLTVVEKKTGKRTPLTVDVVGRHNGYNIAAAFAAGRWAGMDEEEIVQALQGYRSEGLRQNVLNIGGCTLIVDAFNSVDLSLISSLQSLAQMKVPPGGRRIAVLGESRAETPDEDEESQYMALPPAQEVAYAVRNLDIDQIVTFGPDGQALVQELEKGFIQARHFKARSVLHSWLWENIRPGDAVLFKGTNPTATALSVDAVVGTDFRFNYAPERRTFTKPFELGAFQGLIFRDRLAVLEKQDCRSANVIIPNMIQKKPLVYLNKRVFAGSRLQSVAIGDQVVGIGERSFYYCRMLNRVVFGKRVRNIGREAFAGCESLREVILPRGCIHIGERAFAGCTGLKRVILSKTVGYVAEDAFDGCPEVEIIREQDVDVNELLLNKEGEYLTQEEISQPREEWDKLTLGRICELMGLSVPAPYKSIQDRIVPAVTPEDPDRIPGSVFFYDKNLPNAEEKCINAFQHGAVMAITDTLLRDELRVLLPQITVRDGFSACAPVGRYIRGRFHGKVVCVAERDEQRTLRDAAYKALEGRCRVHTSLRPGDSWTAVLDALQSVPPESEVYLQKVQGVYPAYMKQMAKMLQPDVAVCAAIPETFPKGYGQLNAYQEDYLSVLDVTLENGGMIFVNLDEPLLEAYVERPNAVTFSVVNENADYCLTHSEYVNGVLELYIRRKGEAEDFIRYLDSGNMPVYGLAACALADWLEARGEIGQSRWQEKGGERCCADKNGVFRTGFVEADGRLYYLSGQDGYVLRDCWLDVEDKRYRLSPEDGAVLKGFTVVDGVTYYLSLGDGHMLRDCFITDGENRYHLAGDGSVERDRSITVDGKTYYLDADGHLMMGCFIETDGRQYYLSEEDGHVLTDCFITVDENQYYLAGDGSVERDCSITVKDKIYYLDADGHLMKGCFIEIDGRQYYLSGQDGHVLRGCWLDVEDRRYRLENGAILKGFNVIRGETYYMSTEDGHMLKDCWVTEDSNRYYMSAEDGHMLRGGFITVGGNRYYLADDGGMERDRLITVKGKTYYLDRDGCLVKGRFVNADGRQYYMSAIDGHMLRSKGGFITVDGNRYYLANDGSVEKDRLITIKDKTYYFGEDGCLIKGRFVNVDGRQYYMSRADGHLLRGCSVTVDGDQYYLADDGSVEKNRLITIKRKTYYLDEDGRLMKGCLVKADGKRYYLSEKDGHVMKGGWVNASDGKQYYLSADDGHVINNWRKWLLRKAQRLWWKAKALLKSD